MYDSYAILLFLIMESGLRETVQVEFIDAVAVTRVVDDDEMID